MKIYACLFLMISVCYGVEARNKIICEHGGKKTISCSPGLIRIDNAYYGRTQPNYCGVVSNVNNCIASGSQQIIQDKCTGKPTCELDPSYSVFGDPCFGSVKYIEVTYTCIFTSTTAVTTRTTQTTSPTTQISETTTKLPDITATSQQWNENTTEVVATTYIPKPGQNANVGLILGITLPLIALCAIGAFALYCVVKRQRQSSGGSIKKLHKNHDDTVTSATYVNATGTHDVHVYENSVWTRNG